MQTMNKDQKFNAGIVKNNFNILTALIVRNQTFGETQIIYKEQKLNAAAAKNISSVLLVLTARNRIFGRKENTDSVL